MKRVYVTILFIALILSVECCAFASTDQLVPYATRQINVRCNIAQRNGLVTGSAYASVPAGKSLVLTVTLQSSNLNGYWKSEKTISGNGEPITVSCTAYSGSSFRIRYSYKLYDSSNELEESGSGYSHVIQVP